MQRRFKQPCLAVAALAVLRTNTCAAVAYSGGNEGGERLADVAPGDVYANLRERKTKPPLLTARRVVVYTCLRGMFAICKHSKQLVREVSMGRNEMEMVVGRIGF